MEQEHSISPARRRTLFGAAAALAGLAGAGLAWWRYRPADVDDVVMASIWSLDFGTPGGGRLALQSFRGRPLLINFWATWCPPCVEELPLLDAFYKENESKGWQVLGLAVDKVDPVRAFLQRQPLAFPVALAGMEGLAVSKTLGNLAGGLPFTVLVGAAGTVLERKIGKLNESDLRLWRELK